MNKKDKIYITKKNNIENFRFDEKTAEVFDDMASRSIPYYADLQETIAYLTTKYYKKGTYLYDIGCSTGNTLIPLHKQNIEGLKVVALDLSKEMIDIAKQKCPYDYIEWVCAGVENVEFKPASVINISYVLQFIDRELRKEILKKSFDSLEEGGVLILSEKLMIKNEKLENIYIHQYENFKRANGYSDLEIEQKKQALIDVLRPFTFDEYIDILTDIGFKDINITMKYLNFTTMVAVKEYKTP